MLSRLRDAKYCQVVGLRASAGKDDFRGAASQQRGHGLPRALHGRSRLLSMMMDGRRIPEALHEVGLHSLKDRGQHRCGGVIVEVDAAHGYKPFYASLKTGTVGSVPLEHERDDRAYTYLSLRHWYIPLRIGGPNVIRAGAD